jgi:hypothetical protein
MTAQGVKIAKINQKTNYHSTSLHIVDSDENFRKGLDEITIVEFLKKG